VFYRVTWKVIRSIGRRITAERRQEGFLSLYGPLSLLGLLAMWVVAQILGWGLIWWSLRDQMTGVSSLLDAIYYAGVGFFTVGFGDVLPTGGVARVLTLFEAFVGVGTTALVIGYLPVLYSAYSARESQLLSLDDLTGDRITPVALIEAHAPDGDTATLYDWFSQWERWCSGILESHTSYPMLTYFRSQHPGQSWVTALGVVTDAATLVLATVDEPRSREPLMLYRRATRTLPLLAQRLGTDEGPTDNIRIEFFEIAYQRLAATGLPVRSFDDAWADLTALRAAYGGWLEALIDDLAAPRGFWGHAIDMPAVGATRSPAERIWGEAGPPAAPEGS
jgi:hypothetical protein